MFYEELFQVLERKITIQNDRINFLSLVRNAILIVRNKIRNLLTQTNDLLS